MNKKIWERVDSQGDGRDALLIEHICLIPRSLNVRNPSHHSFSIVSVSGLKLTLIVKPTILNNS